MREPRFWQQPRAGDMSILPRLLAPAAYLYGLGGRVRRHYANSERPSVPVICVGNITAGGTGKTPIALSLAARLIALGEDVHFLTRGYGGREHGPLRVDLSRDHAADVGDEPLLLAALAPTWVSVDRGEGAAAAARAGASLIIMDDGFQNPTIDKDLSLLVVDAATGIGNGRLIPAGPLRERTGDALSRAGAIVKVGRGHAADGLAARARNRALPVFHAILRAAPAPELDGLPVLAFAGIGRPEKFYGTLLELHADLVATESFPDHHVYTERDAQRLLIRARDLGATLVTTEKDRVRLLHAPEGSQLARLRDTAKTVSVRAVFENFPAFEALVRDAIAAARRKVRGKAPGR